MLGPRQVRFADPLHPPTVPPFEIGDNPHSLLDVADLLFIDPPLVGESYGIIRAIALAGMLSGGVLPPHGSLWRRSP
jgi:carboxypeptidase C (cathepsin A)